MKKLLYIGCVLSMLSLIACDNSTELEDENFTSVHSTADTTEYNIKGHTEAGYEYLHHIRNNTTRPEVGDQVTYHKIVYKNDTTVLQSTYYLLEARSDILAPPDSIPQPPHPTYHSLFLMSPGDSLTVYQPLDTFPAEVLPKGITNQDRFTYNLKMISIKPKAVIEKEIADTKARHRTVGDSLKTFIQEYKFGKLNDQIVTTETGLKYFIHKQGTGKKVNDGGFVKVHFLGMLDNGTAFDGTFASAKPFPTRIGRAKVIAGWDEGIPLLNTGGEATFIVPYTLAYGEAGKPPGIPERADLYFFVSLVNVY
jgi:FKBP-type peptidyl-prolyl cis-trans isomerase FkpA